MSVERKVDKLEESVKLEFRDIYKSLTDFKVNIRILMDTVEKLNVYTHDRIHYLTNSDKGVELVLGQLKDKLVDLEESNASKKEFTRSVKKRTTDVVLRIFSSTVSASVMLMLGMMIQGHHWFR